jgi:hypothetical protein
MKFEFVFIIVFITLMITILLIYGFGEKGRLVRDYGISSSHISDNRVKDIWCDRWAENNGYDNNTTMVNIFYKKEDRKEYCGDIEVKMDCMFSNSGDYCSIRAMEILK